MIEVSGRHYSIDELMVETSRAWREGKTLEAIEFLDRAAESCINDTEAAFRIADSYRDIGQTDKARSILDTLSKSEEHCIWLRATIDKSQLLIIEEKFSDAERLLWQAHQSEASNPWPIYRLVELYQKKQDFTNATAIVKAFERLSGKGIDLLAQLIMTHTSQRVFDQYQVDQAALTKRATVAALDRCGMISMVKNEDDIFGSSLDHHYEIGFRSFCVVDNNSSDQTATLVANFRDSHPDCFLLYINDPGRKHYQARKMDIYGDAFVAAANMDGKSIDWLFYLDADEFIVPLSPKADQGEHPNPVEEFGRILENPKNKVLVFHWVHGVSSTVLESAPPDMHPFNIYSSIQKNIDPIVSKVSLRVGLKPTQGNHSVEGEAPLLDSYVNMAESGWCILHFPMRSVDQYRRKIINGATANTSAPGLETAASHWKAYYEEYKMHGDDVFRQIIQNFINNISNLTPNNPKKQI